MLQELNKLQKLKNYKDVRITFLKDETNNYIENVQMLVFFKEFEKPVYATGLSSFELYKKTVYKRERVWANIPIICNCTSREVTKVKLKEKEIKKLSKFLSGFTFKTGNRIYDDIMAQIYKMNGSEYSKKPESSKRKKVEIISI